MKATKKLFALILAAAMALSLAACGSGGTTETIANAAPGTAEKTVSNKHYDITLGTAGTTGTYYVVGAAIANAVNNVAPNLTVVAQATNGGVENINLHINKGEFVFIVGSSGSGKSTLMKLLLKELDPTEGDIIINKVKTNELNRRQIPYLRRNLGVVFQDFRLLPNKTVYENVAFAMRGIEAPGRIIRRNVPAVLSLVGLG